MDRRAVIPEPLVQTWNEEVRKRLDQDLQNIISNILGRTDHILSNTQFYMVGVKLGEVLLAEPTVVITCGTKKCKRKVSKLLNKLKLCYLEEFNRPIKVLYQRAPSYWAAKEVLENMQDDTMMVDSHAQDPEVERLPRQRHLTAAASPERDQTFGAADSDSPAPLQGLYSIQNLCLQKVHTSTSCGLKLRSEVQFQSGGSKRTCYSTLGGISCIDGFSMA